MNSVFVASKNLVSPSYKQHLDGDWVDRFVELAH